MTLKTSKTADRRIPLDSARLRLARQQTGLSLAEAAKRAGLNKMTLTRYESGDIRSAACASLHRLAAAYECPPFWLAGMDTGREFFAGEQELLLSPRTADSPSGLGSRLLSCLHYLDRGRD